MPSVSERQRKFFGAEYGRAKAGKQTRTGMSPKNLKPFLKKRGNPTAKRFHG